MNPFRRWLTWLTILIFLVPAFLGFGNKFLEFLALRNDPDGSFTLVPIMNYLLASLGFFMLLAWAILHGMFRDVEQPKYDMLRTEQALDDPLAARDDPTPSPPVLRGRGLG